MKIKMIYIIFRRRVLLFSNYPEKLKKPTPWMFITYILYFPTCILSVSEKIGAFVELVAVIERERCCVTAANTHMKERENLSFPLVGQDHLVVSWG